MSRRRRLAALVGVVGLACLAIPSVLHAAGGPSGASLPDFSASNPLYVQSIPPQWDLLVTTGQKQMSQGDTVTFTFQYNETAPDPQHAVAFAAPGPQSSNGVVSISSLGVPGLPTEPTPCSRTRLAGQLSAGVSTDPYSQTLTITMGQIYPPNSTLDFCINGLVGFPAAPGPGYSILYTEPSGSTRAPYTLTAQTTPQSHSTHLFDGDRDVTSAGIGGLAPAVVGSTYLLKLVGQPTTAPSSIYRLSASAFDVATDNVDTSAKVSWTGGAVLPGGGAPSTCVSGGGQVCVGPDGTGTPNLTVSGVDQPAYLLIGSSGGTQESVNDLISVTIAPVHAPPPTARPTQTPPPVPPGGGPPPGFVNDCKTSGGDIAGLGSVEVLTALSHGILPAFATECPTMGANVSFYASTDNVALASLIGATAGAYTYTGMDRALTSSEWSQASASQVNGSSVQQFPIFLDPLVITYNIGSCTVSPVQLGSSTLSSIFTGTFTNWNQVPGMQSCNLPILVAHDIGTASFVLKDYLSKRNATWHAYKQPQLATSWPGNATVACTANGSDAMAMCVLGRPGMIGYGFYGAIHGAGLPIAQVDNPAGFYTGPVQAGCTAAADGPPNPAQSGTLTGQPNPVVPSSTQADWSNASLTDAAWGYPICSFDFITLPSHLCQNNAYHDPQVTKAFLEGTLTDYTQRILVAHGFAALPTSVMNLEASGISSIVCR